MTRNANQLAMPIADIGSPTIPLVLDQQGSGPSHGNARFAGNQMQSSLSLQTRFSGLMLGISLSLIACGMLTLSGCSDSKDSTAEATAPAANTSETPLALSGEGAKPKVTIIGGTKTDDGAEFDFGSTEVGQEFEHVFKIKNDGDGRLEMTKGSPSCTTCTSFEVDNLNLDPGQTATVTVKWKIKSENPEFRQYVPLNTAPPSAPGPSPANDSTIKLYVKGQVVRRIIISPAQKFDMGTMDEGKPLTFVGSVSSAILEDFKVSAVRSDNPKLEVSYTPLSEEKLKELKAKFGFEIKCVLAPDIPVGEFNGKVDLDVLSPEPLTLSVDVGARRSGPIEIIGPNWDPKKMQVRLGSFNAKKDLSQRLSLYTRGFQSPLTFEKIETADPRFTAEIVADERFKGSDETHRRYNLFIKYLKSDREAAYPSPKPLALRIQTNQPSIDAINLTIVGHGTIRD